MSDTPETVRRITEYLTSGGLFNPELAIHENVRGLLIDARDELIAAIAEVARLKAGGCARDAGTSESGCSDSSSLFDGYPVIATIDAQEIGAPWKLVAHRNGPAMTNGDIISVIDPHKDDTPRAAELKRKAVRLFREWAWAKLVGEFYPNTALTGSDQREQVR